MDNSALIPLDKIIRDKLQLERALTEAENAKDKIKNVSEKRPNALRISNRLFDSIEIKEGELNRTDQKVDEAIQTLYDVKSVIHNIKNVLNDSRSIINNTIMDETLQEKSLKAIRKYNTVADNPSVQAILDLDPSFLAKKGGKTIRKKSKHRDSRKKKSATTRRNLK